LIEGRRTISIHGVPPVLRMGLSYSSDANKLEIRVRRPSNA
jgi:hypothetical protein